MLLAALWPINCCTSSTSCVGNSGPLEGGAIGKPGEGPKRGRRRRKGGLQVAQLQIFSNVRGASPVCGTPSSSSLLHVSPFLSLAPFSTVLPGGCPACDTHALQGALLCLKHHYESIPLPSGLSFNSSWTLRENAADIGGLAIALQVTRIPRDRIY